jgi:phosphate uptake regulator
MEFPSDTANTFAWSFRHTKRPFPGKTKVLEHALRHLRNEITGFTSTLAEVDTISSGEFALAADKAQHAVDQLEVHCLRCLTLQGLRPSQRRIISTVLRGSMPFRKVIQDLELVGEKLRQVRSLSSVPLPVTVRRMGNESRSMLLHALDAFQALDGAQAQAVVDQEPWFAGLAARFQSWAALTIYRPPQDLTWLFECHLIAYHWERVASGAAQLAREILMAETSLLPVHDSVLVQ